MAPIPDGARIGGFVASSLLAPLNQDPATHRWQDDPAEQAASLFQAIAAFMEKVGGTPANILQLTFYVIADEYRRYINPEWLKMFPDPNSRPGRIVVYREFPGHNLFFEASLIAIL
jgi:enamine deaminase RidA (YjgF/YER057c/UK114 family)